MANCVEALQEAAKREYVPDKRYMLAGAATLLYAAIEAFRDDPTTENMIELNGIWSYSARVIKLASPIVDPSGGGHMPVPQERKVA